MVLNEKSTILFFYGSASALSNWHPNAGFWVNAIWFCNVEAFMMYCKAKLFQDHEIADRILSTENPANHKRLGREVRGFVESDWIAKREHYVYIGCLAKFQQNPSIGVYLKATGNCELVEASPTDTIWGIGLAESDDRIKNRHNWRGQNLLGKVLMRVRDELCKSG